MLQITLLIALLAVLRNDLRRTPTALAVRPASTSLSSHPATQLAVDGTWTGFAERFKEGMYLRGADVYFETSEPTSLAADGKLISVSGILVERHDLDVNLGSPTEPIQSSGAPPGVTSYDASRRMVIEHATWRPSTLATTLPENTWIGIVENHKAGAYLSRVGYYVDLPDNWPFDALNKLVRVTGTPVIRHDLPVFIAGPTTGPELPIQGIPVPPGTDLHKASERTVIENLKWELIPQGTK